MRFLDVCLAKSLTPEQDTDDEEGGDEDMCESLKKGTLCKHFAPSSAACGLGTE